MQVSKKNKTFALIFENHFGHHHQRQKERERERGKVFKGGKRQLGIGERETRNRRVVSDHKPKKGWAPPPRCKTNCQSIVLKTGFQASVLT